ncbi:hypothetical protein CRUP_025287, partial [Coryphaenoides rupestris]
GASTSPVVAPRKLPALRALYDRASPNGGAVESHPDYAQDPFHMVLVRGIALPTAPRGLVLSAPSGLVLSAPSGLVLSAPRGLVLYAPRGLELYAPSGLVLSAPSGLVKLAPLVQPSLATVTTATAPDAAAASAAQSAAAAAAAAAATPAPSCRRCPISSHKCPRTYLLLLRLRSPRPISRPLPRRSPAWKPKASSMDSTVQAKPAQHALARLPGQP